ncbi:hypothetical protein PSCLAVI8L_280024 [Pseudoclavibacter sp. 8L]|nr:hypothetical protein PSCLAVI8L_280024 [Pseudoclavibacter sp. 8L]
MPHEIAPLISEGRRRLANPVLEHGWTMHRAVERRMVAFKFYQHWGPQRMAHGLRLHPLLVSRDWMPLPRHLDQAANITHRRTRAYRHNPGELERFNRALANKWAYRQPFASNTARHDALAAWIEHHTTERIHSGHGLTPAAGASPTP